MTIALHNPNSPLRGLPKAVDVVRPCEAPAPILPVAVASTEEVKVASTEPFAASRRQSAREEIFQNLAVTRDLMNGTYDREAPQRKPAVKNEGPSVMGGLLTTAGGCLLAGVGYSVASAALAPAVAIGCVVAGAAIAIYGGCKALKGLASWFGGNSKASASEADGVAFPKNTSKYVSRETLRTSRE